MLPVPPPLPPIPSRAIPAPPSLWRDLSDGSAGWGVRLLVNFSLAVALGGLVPILAYFLAAVNPGWNRYPSYGIYPRDELVAFLAAAAGGGLLAATAWLWSRTGRRRAVLAPVVLTIGVIAATVALGVLAEENLPGDGELVVGGLVALAGASVILIWLQAFRRRGPRWRALHNQQDGMLDVRCPACDYRMVGLTESRCPECGMNYTLDELIAKQGFGPATGRAVDLQAQQGQGVPPSLRSA